MAERKIVFEPTPVDSVRLSGLLSAGYAEGFGLAAIVRIQVCTSCTRHDRNVSPEDYCEGVENISSSSGILYQDGNLEVHVVNSISSKCPLVDTPLSVSALLVRGKPANY